MSRARPLSADMWEALGQLAKGQTGFVGLFGRERQARGNTMVALIRRGLVCRCPLGLYWLTDAGKALVRESSA